MAFKKENRTSELELAKQINAFLIFMKLFVFVCVF